MRPTAPGRTPSSPLERRDLQRLETVTDLDFTFIEDVGVLGDFDGALHNAGGRYRC